MPPKIKPTNKADVDRPRDIPGLESLGQTYDVIYGAYADPLSCKISVIDWDKGGGWKTVYPGTVEYSVPKDVSYTYADDNGLWTSYGDMASEYSTSLAVHAGLEGNYSFFSASVSADYTQSETQNLSMSFARANALVKRFKLTLPRNIKKLLTDDFVDDLETLDAKELYRYYGTHIVNSLVAGARASFIYATNKREYTGDQSIEAAAQVSCQALMWGVSADVQAKYQKSMTSLKQSSTFRVRTQGGDPQYANEKLLENISDWQASVKDHTVFIDFGSQPCLVPLYELVSDKVRRTELENGFKEYLKNGPGLGIKGPFFEARVVDASPLDYYIPGVPKGWQIVGQVQRIPYTIIVKELVPGAIISIPVKKWESTSTSGIPMSSRVWRAEVPRGYVPLSDCIYSMQNPPAHPPEKIVGNIVAVHKSACIKGQFVRGGIFIGAYVDGLHNPRIWYTRPSDPQHHYPAFWMVGTVEQEPFDDGWILDLYSENKVKIDPKMRERLPQKVTGKQFDPTKIIGHAEVVEGAEIEGAEVEGAEIHAPAEVEGAKVVEGAEIPSRAEVERAEKL